MLLALFVVAVVVLIVPVVVYIRRCCHRRCRANGMAAVFFMGFVEHASRNACFHVGACFLCKCCVYNIYIYVRWMNFVCAFAFVGGGAYSALVRCACLLILEWQASTKTFMMYQS